MIDSQFHQWFDDRFAFFMNRSTTRIYVREHWYIGVSLFPQHCTCSWNPSLWKKRTHHGYIILWLLMSWRCKEPGYQQPWYWPSFSSSPGQLNGIFCSGFGAFGAVFSKMMCQLVQNWLYGTTWVIQIIFIINWYPTWKGRYHMISQILVTIGSGDSTKPLPETMLIYHQWGSVAFN